MPTHTFRDHACTTRADPVNLVVVGETVHGVASLLARSVSAKTGKAWHRPAFWKVATASDQWLRLAGPPYPKQVDQLVSGRIWSRYHVRLWNSAGEVIASAHHERLLTLFPRPKVHEPSSFEAGKLCIADDLSAQGKTVDRYNLQLNDWQALPVDSGRAAVAW